jgi:hypothetical protein
MLPCLAVGTLVIGAALVSGSARGASPCAADIEKFCAKVPIGGGRIQACLTEHEKELSPECAARQQNLQKEVGSLAATCRADIARFCSDVPPGRGRIVRCLEQRGKDVSPSCMDRLRKAAQPAPK